MKLTKKTSGQAQSEGTQNIIEPQDWEQFMDDIFCELSRYDYLRITPDTDIAVPVPLIKIGEEIVSTEGNLTTVSGASKSGKSALLSWLIAGAISVTGILIDSLEGLEIEPNPDGKAVIHFDTEQSKYDHQKKLRTILKRAGFTDCPRYFRSYNIRELELSSYITNTQKICEYANKHFGGVHLIAVDGGADYIQNVNDPEQSRDIIKYFGDLAIKYTTPVIIITHTNPDGSKERGHMGSECQRKSESVLRVLKNGDVSHIEPVFLRNAGDGAIPRIQFIFDKEKGYHVSCGFRPSGAASKEAERLQFIRQLADNVFAPPAAYKYGEAIEHIIAVSKRAVATSKGYFTVMKDHKMIVQGDDEMWRLSV
jgi:hypothetical protein